MITLNHPNFLDLVSLQVNVSLACSLSISCGHLESSDVILSTIFWLVYLVPCEISTGVFLAGTSRRAILSRFTLSALTSDPASSW